MRVDFELDRMVGVIAERWRRTDFEVLRHLFPLLGRGKPISLDDLAATGEFPRERLARAWRLPHLSRNRGGLATELFGLSTESGAFRPLGDREGVFTCCALIACMVPLLTDTEQAWLETTDPVSGGRVELVVSRHGAVEPRSADARATCVALAADPGEEMGDRFCRHVRLFESPATAERFAQAEPDRFVVPIERLRIAADALWRRVVPAP